MPAWLLTARPGPLHDGPKESRDLQGAWLALNACLLFPGSSMSPDRTTCHISTGRHSARRRAGAQRPIRDIGTAQPARSAAFLGLFLVASSCRHVPQPYGRNVEQAIVPWHMPSVAKAASYTNEPLNMWFSFLFTRSNGNQYTFSLNDGLAPQASPPARGYHWQLASS